MMKYINEIENDIKGKTVLLRVDFNVPVHKDDQGDYIVTEDFRIRAVKKTIDYILGKGGRIMLVSHITDIDSFEPIISSIARILQRDLVLCKVVADIGNSIGSESLSLLENIRTFEGEEKNDPQFAQSLAESFDIYVNDAFAVSHRAHASVSAITKFLPFYAGLVIKDEVAQLQKDLDAPVAGKVLVIGGAKIATKLPVIKNFFDKAEHILVGGALANTFFKAEGRIVGTSKVDDDTLSEADFDGDTLVLPEDILVSADGTGKQAVHSRELNQVQPNEMILDIGVRTRKRYSEIIASSSMVIWNGPMGLFEVEQFAAGTHAIAQAVATAPYSVVGGGDTISATRDLLEKFTYVSTGGGAMLEFLAGKKLPGLEALGYYEL